MSSFQSLEAVEAYDVGTSPRPVLDNVPGARITALGCCAQVEYRKEGIGGRMGYCMEGAGVA